ncbi:MAG TPA: carboxypeptidase regulatory-like domain-containing protein [Dermatophilaceae bacterium]|nr:carboxypeptidase regulatory-like domain-containing protein [Dermatophilaceae bacterium]
MNEQRQTPGEAELELLAGQDLDDVDVDILAELARIYQAADPMPDGLTDRLEFALALDEVYAEVAQLTRMSGDAALVRGETTQTRAQTLTFSADSLTAMITLSTDGATIRIDGWLTPAAPVLVNLRTTARTVSTVADATGRFAFDEVPAGLAQLTFQPEGEAGPSVITPAFEV